VRATHPPSGPSRVRLDRDAGNGAGDGGALVCEGAEWSAMFGTAEAHERESFVCRLLSGGRARVMRKITSRDQWGRESDIYDAM
jgi:hypothetical protein